MKTIYTFGNGKAEGSAEMRDLLGGKGANLAEMNLIGVPVPPGFTITTDMCRLYNEKGRDEVGYDRAVALASYCNIWQISILRVFELLCRHIRHPCQHRHRHQQTGEATIYLFIPFHISVLLRF